MSDKKKVSPEEMQNMMKLLGLPSVKEFLEFDADGATRKYEEIYTALLDRVKDKTTDEKIAYIKEYVPSLRKQVSLMASTHDMLYTSETDDGLAFILVYRYEHHISIFDDLELEITREPVKKYLAKLDDIEIDKRIQAKREFMEKYPEEYERQKKMKLEREMARNRKSAEELLKFYEGMSDEEILNLALGRRE